VKDGVAEELAEAVYWNEMYAEDTPDVVVSPVAALWPTEAAGTARVAELQRAVDGRETIVAETEPASMSCT
jgi:hypothetical protein